MSQQLSITSVDISNEAPRKYVIGGGRTVGIIAGQLVGITQQYWEPWSYKEAMDDGGSWWADGITQHW
jgi:hypothetical protein